MAVVVDVDDDDDDDDEEEAVAPPLFFAPNAWCAFNDFDFIVVFD